jgi:Xaa-Pro dipeptidase
MTMDFDYDLVTDLEFDALRIQIPEPLAKGPVDTHRYPAKLHARRVARLLAPPDGSGIIYLRGARSDTYPDSDQARPHRQARHFYYLTGVDAPDFEATYDVGADRLVLWIPPPRSPRDALYNGDVPGVHECLRRYDVDDARYAPELPAFLAARRVTIYALHEGELPAVLMSSSSPASSPPASSLPSPSECAAHSSLALLGAPSTFAAPPLSSVDDGLAFIMGGCFFPTAPAHPLAAATPVVDSTSLLPAIDAARVVKTPHEVAMIRRACAVSSRAHRAVAAQLRHMYAEGNAEATFAATCTNLGARSQAYPIIAGAGANAARLHYEDNAAPLLDSQFLVLDAGCEWRCYASDVTRTLPIAGKWRSPEARAVHDLVARMQDAVLAMVRPGAHWLDFVDKAHDIGLLGLHDLGLLRGDPLDLLTAGRAVMAAFLPHGLGHPVGLEVHDFPAAYYTATGGGGGVSSAAAASHRRAAVGVPPLETLDAAARTHHTTTTTTPSVSSSSPDDALFDPRAWMLMRPGMVVAIEPGLYFNRAYIDAFLAAQPKLARLVDRDVLARFWQVGGCRIEDVVLVTDQGSEVLSAAAPKGEELWDVIRRG